MRILLTGSNGMVGKNIIEFQKESSYEFLTPSRKKLDLLDSVSTCRYLVEHKPDMVIHAAGVVGGIQANIAKPVKFLTENMQIGLNIITAARQAGVGKFLNLSSSCMYPKDANNPLSEELILSGELEPTNEGYALAKIATTRLCEYICQETPELLYRTVIPCNLYGRHDKFDVNNSHMIPAVIQKLDEAKRGGIREVEIWGSGDARREFMYAGDFADFVFYAIQNFGRVPQNLNVGLGFDYSINEYYRAIANVVGYSGGFKHNLSKPVGMKQKLIDDRKLHELGWNYKTSLETGINKTYQFYLGESFGD